MAKKIAPRFPVREWLGRYESFWLTMYGRKGYKKTDRNLEHFLHHFKEYEGLEQFTIAEVTDYVAWQLRSGVKPYTIMMELIAVRKFWRWLTEQKNLPLTCPVRKGIMKELENRLRKVEQQNKVLEVASIPVFDTSAWDFGV